MLFHDDEKPSSQVHGHVAERFFLVSLRFVLSHVINVTLQKAFSISKLNSNENELKIGTSARAHGALNNVVNITFSITVKVKYFLMKLKRAPQPRSSPSFDLDHMG